MITSSQLRILFLTESREDYLADSLLHGLISLNANVVDFPRKDCLYSDLQHANSESNIKIRGNGFTLYHLLRDRDVDRRSIVQRIEKACFDVVIFGQIWRQWGQLLDLAPFLQDTKVVLLDGDDDSRIFFQSGTRLRRYGYQPFPIRSGKCIYLKRELTSPVPFTRHCRVLPFGFSIPSEKIVPLSCITKTKKFATHCVDTEVADTCGLKSSYAFSTEQEYYADLSASHFAITTKRGGWDCLRHYEIVAAGSVPCFRNLDRKPSSCAPIGLTPSKNCLSYTDWHDLNEQVNNILSSPYNYSQLQTASRAWLYTNTTTSAAARFLEAVAKL